MTPRDFDPVSWNCGLAAAGAFPRSPALAREAAQFLALSEAERRRLFNETDVLSFAREVATRYNLPSAEIGETGNAWGVARLSGSHIFAFRLSAHWWAQAERGVLRIEKRCIVAAWEIG